MKKMIKIYTTPSCASCRKAKLWLEEHNIPYVLAEEGGSVIA